VRHWFSHEDLRRHVLAKQHLADDDAAPGVVHVTDDLVGLHATGTTSPYLQLFARLPHVPRSDLDEALYRDRSLARVRCMRRTVFIVSRALLPMVLAATRRLTEPLSTRYLTIVGVSETDYLGLAARIDDILQSAGEALSATALRHRMGADHSLSPVINLMCDQGRLLRDLPIGSWKSRTFTYRRFDDVFPDIAPVARKDAVRELAERYIRAYGPVTLDDLVWWSGLRRRELREAVADLGSAIVEVEVEVDDGASGWLAHADDVAARGPGSDESAPSVRLLPELDPYLMGRHARHAIIDSALVDYVTDRAGNVTSTVVVDGRVAGVWDVATSPGPAVRLHLFPRARPFLAEAREQAARVGQYWFGGQVPVHEIGAMTPLTMRTAGGVLSPLADPTQVPG
jgi:hypothetical protein